MDRNHGISSRWFTTNIWENMFASLFHFASWPSKSIENESSVIGQLGWKYATHDQWYFRGPPNKWDLPFMVSGTHRNSHVRIPKDIYLDESIGFTRISLTNKISSIGTAGSTAWNHKISWGDSVGGLGSTWAKVTQSWSDSRGMAAKIHGVFT